MKRETVRADGYPEPAAAYSQAVLVEGGKMLFISGQVPVDREGNLVGKNDLEAQTRQVFENIRAHLEAAGASFADVVKLTIFITDMTNFATFSRVRSEYLEPDYPAASAIGVASLVNPDWLIEVEAIAVLD